ncbi:SRPBCC family protein [Fulvimonas yonginensis]|uniref:SRPBCC family protein n=1 Tax=Fulvimonas yonginensis TaxID=1495200 RepID=A0ABU8JDI9_9GAMM
MTGDRIEKQVELKAPVARVWRALTDHEEFGRWFGVRLAGPFEPGKESTGQITYPGYEHIAWRATIVAMEPERLFSLTWHPYPVDPDVDYSAEPQTLVEFRLQPLDGGGTLLTVTESGFDRIPAHRRAEAFRANEGGWAEQMRNIRRHLGEPAA